MKTQDLAVIAGIGALAFILWKPLRETFGGVTTAVQGAGTATANVLDETAQTYGGANDVLQALFGRVEDAIQKTGRNPGLSNAGDGSTRKPTPQLQREINQAKQGVNITPTATYVEARIEQTQAGTTYYSPIFKGGSYTAPAQSTKDALTNKKPTTTQPTVSRSGNILAPRTGGGYKVIGAKNITLKR